MAGKKESFRYWLTFEPETGKKPLLYQMVKKFDVEFNVRSASADKDGFVMALEFVGPREKIEEVVKWFGKQGVQVEAKDIQAMLGALEKAFPGIHERLVDEKGEVRRFVNIYVGGEDIRFLQNQQTPLKAGDEVSIVPAIAGG